MNAKPRIPAYRRHKATGQAVVTIGGRDIYLGKHGTAASRQEYARLIHEWTANPGMVVRPTADLTIVELVLAFLKHARSYYRCKTVKPSGEYANYVHAVRPLKELYGRLPAHEFGPTKLKAVREKMILLGWSRQYINRSVHRLKHIFKWAVTNELVPHSTVDGVLLVDALREGRSEAREAARVLPVPDAHIDEVLQFVSPTVAAMIELQRISGMRSGELIAMRGIDLDTAGKVWVYSPPKHKTAWRGHERKIYLGPRAQRIIRPFLKTDLQAHLFSPAETMLKLHAAQHEARKTPLSCGNRPGTNRKAKPRRKAGDCYDNNSYRRAITRGIERANKARLAAAEADGIEAKDVALLPSWHPHQLRHNAATNLRREHGIEVARIILGHQSIRMAEQYAEVDCSLAIDVMAKIG